MITAGIDCGLDGGIALASGLTLLSLYGMPTTTVVKGRRKSKSGKMVDTVDRVYEVNECRDILRDFKLQGVELIYLEKNSLRKGEGIRSAMKNGEGRMLWIALASALEIPLVEVASQEWTKVLELPGKKAPKRNTEGEQPYSSDPGALSDAEWEALSLRARVIKATELFPEYAHHFTGPRGGLKGTASGKTDAALISVYTHFKK